MNRFVYTFLVAAISVGITLALSAACSKKCVCDNYGQQADPSVSETNMDQESNEEAEAQGAGNSGSTNSTGTNSSKKTTSESAGNTSKDEPLKKYGNAETGGNVYTIGGVSPASEKAGGSVTDSNSTKKAVSTKPSKPARLKTASDGQRN